MTIQIKITSSDKHTAYHVQVGPDNHISSETHHFFWKVEPSEDDDTKEVAWHKANAYADGAYFAIQVAASLAAHFMQTGNVIHEEELN